MSDFFDTLNGELFDIDGLSERIRQLAAFLADPQESSGIPRSQKMLLGVQLEVMQDYRNVLQTRLDDLREKGRWS